MTLSCKTTVPLEVSADWIFYWYRAVLVPDGGSFTPEVLPGSLYGTVESSYTIPAPTGTGGYQCRGGRGDNYTDFSDIQFVFSAGE